MSDNNEPVYTGILVEDTGGDEEYARLLQTQEEVIARPVEPGYGRRMQKKSIPTLTHKFLPKI